MFTFVVVALVLAVVVLVAVAFFWNKSRTDVQVTRTMLRAEMDASERLREQLSARDRALAEYQPKLEDMAAQAARIGFLSDQATKLESELRNAQTELAAAQCEIAKLHSDLGSERTATLEKLALLDQAQNRMSNCFKTLAMEALAENSKNFTDASTTNLNHLLTPFKDEIKNFRERVENIHTVEATQKGALSAELQNLKAVSLQMTAEAHDLATALKGQKKKQGNWGELVLGNVLDRSGLRDGTDFRREVSFNTEDGRRRPDVIVYLPESKHLVIDAKVSLNAYTRYINAEDDLSRQEALNEHVRNVAERIEELSDRGYFALPGLNSPEIVFMFIPIESAFVEALRADENLFQKAIERNVLVATPTTLLTSLNIVRQLWRFESQNEHTAELADRAAKVYQKLNTFLGTMSQLDRSLGGARKAYDTAINQLVSGRDNLIKQAKTFKDLGVSISADLPQALVAKAELELEFIPDQIDESPISDGEIA